MPLFTNINLYLKKLTASAADAKTYANQAANSAAAAATAAGNAAAVVTGGTATTAPAAGKIPLADANGVIDLNWLGEDIASKIRMGAVRLNDIGTPGKLGFGVGICPKVPDGYNALAGTLTLGSDEYGNYKYTDGSICVWIPVFYARIGHAGNATYGSYGVNSIDIKPYSAYADRTAAAADGFFLPRAFIDGGVVKAGFMVDKYLCSNNNGIASSIANCAPLIASAIHNPISVLNGTPSNTLGGCWAAAKTRGATFFVCSRFIYTALGLLATAHAQASTSTTNCAWYMPDANFPKGCNNSALKDVNDLSVSYSSDGYGSCGKTGSGVPFAKTTHNGQNCGVADLNGLIWEVSQGATCIAVSKAISAITLANPVSIKIAAHGYTSGDIIRITSIIGTTQLNDRIFRITVTDADNFTLDNMDGTTFTAYASGGVVTKGTFYVVNESVSMASLTGGNTLTTDHFGSAGVNATMTPFTPTLITTYPNNAYGNQHVGNGAKQVLSPDTVASNGTICRSLGIPYAVDGLSSPGSALFGNDYYVQCIVNEMCLRSGGAWADGSGAGIWTSQWSAQRASSFDYAGFRSASYPV